MSKKFGDRLKELRKESKLKQEELGLKFGASKASISNYESNKNLPDANTIAEFADFFGVTLDYIMGRSDLKNVYVKDGDSSNEIIHTEISEENKCFSERIRNLMIINGLTADELSKAVGVSKNEFIGFAMGAKFPGANIIRKIAVALNTTTDYLLGMKDDPSVDKENKQEESDELILPDYIEVAKSAQNKKVPLKLLSDFIKLFDKGD